MEMASRVLGEAQAHELHERALDLRSVENVAELAGLFSPR
jgi:hypothetical protein